MGDFFEGWRRKMGLVTLGVAILVMDLWVRSFSTKDEIKIDFGKDKEFAIRPLRRNVISFEITEAYLRHTDYNVAAYKVSYWELPYLWAVAPLTLLSAFLLLSKPRKPT